MALTNEVARAIEEVRATFPESTVTSDEDGSGGAFVTVSELSIGSRFSESMSWLGFHITFNYPEAQVYPHFGVPGLTRPDGSEYEAGDGIQQVEWGPDRNKAKATQFSRSSTRWDPVVDTAANKLLRVLEWLRDG
jgi:hypothetical protein